MPPAARIGDLHICPRTEPGPAPHAGGPIVAGQVRVLLGGAPAATVDSRCTCVGPPDRVAKGSATVTIGGAPAARQGDPTAHGGVIAAGFAPILIGG